jgi:hypothetical protein
MLQPPPASPTPEYLIRQRAILALRSQIANRN